MKDDNPIPEDPTDDASGGVVEGLTTLQSELGRLSELDGTERNHSKKLVESLKVLWSQVDMAAPLQKRSLRRPVYSDTEEVYLASDRVVVINREEDLKRSVPLARFEPKYSLSIAKEATPGLVAMISESRREVGSRVDLLQNALASE